MTGDKQLECYFLLATNVFSNNGLFFINNASNINNAKMLIVVHYLQKMHRKFYVQYLFFFINNAYF